MTVGVTVITVLNDSPEVIVIYIYIEDTDAHPIAVILMKYRFRHAL